MSIVTTGDKVERKLGSDDSLKYNVRFQELQRIDLLARSDWPLSDFRDEEITAFSIYRALDAGLKQEIVLESGEKIKVGGLPMTMQLIENIRDMRPSRARLGRKELIEAIGKGRPVQPWELPPMYEAERADDKPSIWDRILPWRRR